MNSRRAGAEDVGLVLRDPGNLGAGRLSGQGGSAPPHDLLGAVALVQPGDLRRGPGVDTVQNRRPQRPPIGVGEQDARAHPADTDRRHLRVAGIKQLADERDKLLPPDPGVHLDPAGVRAIDRVLPHG